MNIDHKLSFLGHLWNAVPGADIESKVGFIASILGIISFLIWVYEHRRKGPVLSASQVSEIAATLAARLRNTAAPEGLVPKDAEESLLREAISDLQNIKSVSTKAAMAKLKDGDPKAAAAVFRETAMGLESQGKLAFAGAAENYRKAAALSGDKTNEAVAAYGRATELDPGNAEGWWRLGMAQIRANKLASAQRSFEAVERLGNSIQDKSILADAFRALGFLKTESGSVDEVRSYYAKAIAIDRELNALDNLARDYHLLGGLLMMNGEVSEGEEFLKQAAELFAKGGDTSGAAAVTGTLGTLYYARHDYEGAESWLERSVGFAIAGKKSDPVALGAWHMLGATYLALNKHDQAAKALAPALKLAQELGDRETEAEIRRQIFANSQQETA